MKLKPIELKNQLWGFASKVDVSTRDFGRNRFRYRP